MNARTTFQQWQTGSGLRLRKRQVIVIAVIMTVILVTVGLLSVYTVIRPVYPTSVDASGIQVNTYDTATGEKAPVKRLPGNLLLVSRGAEALAFTTDSQESLLLAPAQLGSFGIASIEVSLTQPSSGKLVSVGSDDCPIISGGKAYSHQCGFATGFSLYTPNAPGLDKQTNSLAFNSKYTSGQYKEGILIWNSRANTRTTSEAELIQYVVPEKGIVNSIELPKEVNRTGYAQIITDNANPQNTAFVAYDYKSGIGYYYSDVASKSEPKIVKRKRSFDVETNTSTCALSSTIFSCYHGQAGEETHDHDEIGFVNEGRPGGSIERTDMAAEKLETRSYSNGGSEIDQLYATASGILYARGGTTLSKIDFQSAGFGLTTISSNSTIIAAGNLLYYAQNDKVYAYDETTTVATMIYDNNTQTLSKLTAHGNRALLLAYNKRDPLQLLNVYDISSGETE